MELSLADLSPIENELISSMFREQECGAQWSRRSVCVDVRVEWVREQEKVRGC